MTLCQVNHSMTKNEAKTSYLCGIYCELPKSNMGSSDTASILLLGADCVMPCSFVLGMLCSIIIVDNVLLLFVKLPRLKNVGVGL